MRPLFITILASGILSLLSVRFSMIIISITSAPTRLHYLVKVFDKLSHSKSPIFGTLYISDCWRDPTSENY